MEAVLFSCVLVTGLYAGIHFFNLIGGLPALYRMTRPETFIEFWQNIDHFMAARMRVFGPLVLLVQLTSIILMAVDHRWVSMGLMIAGFGLTVADAIIAVRGNGPLNRRIQSWSLERVPVEWVQVRDEVARWFGARGVAAIGALACSAAAMLTAVHVAADPAVVVVVVCFVTIMVSGLYGGMHLFNFMGLMPALARMRRSFSFVESWQAIDGVMARRMMQLGPAILVVLLGSAVLLFATGHMLEGSLAAVAFALAAIDAAIAITRSRPLLDRMGTWSAFTPPVDWQRQRACMIQGFAVRGVFAISAFAISLLVGFRG